MTNIEGLKKIIENAETVITESQDDLFNAAVALAKVVGPLATAHRLAILAQEYDDLSKTVA